MLGMGTFNMRLFAGILFIIAVFSTAWAESNSSAGGAVAATAKPDTVATGKGNQNSNAVTTLSNTTSNEITNNTLSTAKMDLTEPTTSTSASTPTASTLTTATTSVASTTLSILTWFVSILNATVTQTSTSTTLTTTEEPSTATTASTPSTVNSTTSSTQPTTPTESTTVLTTTSTLPTSSSTTAVTTTQTSTSSSIPTSSTMPMTATSTSSTNSTPTTASIANTPSTTVTWPAASLTTTNSVATIASTPGDSVSATLTEYATDSSLAAESTNEITSSPDTSPANVLDVVYSSTSFFQTVAAAVATTSNLTSATNLSTLEQNFSNATVQTLTTALSAVKTSVPSFANDAEVMATFDPDPFFKAVVPIFPKVYNDHKLLKSASGPPFVPFFYEHGFFTITLPAFCGMVLISTFCLFCLHSDCFGFGKSSDKQPLVTA